MTTNTRLLLAVIFFYAAVLNMFVTRLFFQRRSLVRLDAPSTPSKRPEALLPPPLTPRIRLDASADSQLAASCPASVPAVVIAVAPGKPGAPPDLRLFSTLRDMLRGFRLRVELVGAPAALTQTHRLWCHSAPLPCGVHELPASSDPLDLAVLTNPLLAIAPCLDDIVLLGSTLPLPPPLPAPAPAPHAPRQAHLSRRPLPRGRRARLLALRPVPRPRLPSPPRLPLADPRLPRAGRRARRGAGPAGPPGAHRAYLTRARERHEHI